MRVERICPAYADGVCHREHAVDGAAHCPLLVCATCNRDVPKCFFGVLDGDCEDCWVDKNYPCTPSDPRAYVS